MTYGSTDVLDRVRPLGVSYRMLDHWVRRGWLHPEVERPGTGRDRQWPPEEVCYAAAMGRLVGCGFLVETAARLARGEPGRVSLCAGVALDLSPEVWAVPDAQPQDERPS